MILVDANVLLYAYDRHSPHHEPSRQWLEAQFSARLPLRPDYAAGVCPNCLGPAGI